MKHNLNLSMSARSLIRQAKCPECYSTGTQSTDNANCTWCLERVQLMDNLLKSSSPNDEALDLLHEIKKACLYTDDDGDGHSYMGVTDSPTIPEELFERICNTLNDHIVWKGTCSCGEYDYPGEEFYNSPVTIEEGTIKKNLNGPPTISRPPPPKAQVAPQRDTTKEVALMALWSVRKEYGAKLHPNFLKDVEMAIEGLQQK